MTKQQTLNDSRENCSGVILNGRFVHRDTANSADSWIPCMDSDEMIKRLAEYFAITQTDVFALPEFDGAENNLPSIVDDLPRFKQSSRDGLQVPKEGKDGTGN